MNDIKTAGIIGLGALGTLYAHLLTEALGRDHVLVLADSRRVDRYRREGVIFNGQLQDLNYTDAAAVTEPVDLLLFAVKFGGLESTSRPAAIWWDRIPPWSPSSTAFPASRYWAPHSPRSRWSGAWHSGCPL